MNFSYRSQAVASVVLGTPLTFALCALYAEFGPAQPATNYLTAVLLLLPVWCGLLLWGLNQADPRKAWYKLGGLTLLAAAAYFALRTNGS